METFTNLYYGSVVQSLVFYEIDRKSLRNDTIINKIELEFNEERGIEIELHMKAILPPVCQRTV